MESLEDKLGRAIAMLGDRRFTKGEAANMAGLAKTAHLPDSLTPAVEDALYRFGFTLLLQLEAAQVRENAMTFWSSESGGLAG